MHTCIERADSPECKRNRSGVWVRAKNSFAREREARRGREGGREGGRECGLYNTATPPFPPRFSRPGGGHRKVRLAREGQGLGPHAKGPPPTSLLRITLFPGCQYISRSPVRRVPKYTLARDDICKDPSRVLPSPPPLPKPSLQSHFPLAFGVFLSFTLSHFKSLARLSREGICRLYSL